MKKKEYNKKINSAVIRSWCIIVVILTISYSIEVLKGLRSVGYVIIFSMVTIAPFISTVIVNRLTGGDDLRIKYFSAMGYTLFYTFSMFTTQVPVSFVYIVPMISILIVYCDEKVITFSYAYAIAINLIAIKLRYNQGFSEPSDITFYEIQIAALVLSAIFSNMALRLMTISVNKMFELSDDILVDELSQAYNRKYISAHIIPLFDFTGEKKNISLAFIDIDYFREYNTLYGHDVGDKTIALIASILLQSCNKHDTLHCIRVGGDEFVIVAVDWEYHTFIELCEEIRQLVSNTTFESTKGNLKLSVSVGIANTLVGNVDDYFGLQDLADEQLYISKEKGRNTVSFVMPKQEG